ncbi:uncharacterized protein LOC143915051 isoform X2 [Arctopsyche grandis]|uniref:uncharacterized protein LOC143915051 isoform X2 n=1 Tax=Arctopsyche grandis TaxID=121162 RepID=UPI00406D9B28
MSGVGAGGSSAAASGLGQSLGAAAGNAAAYGGGAPGATATATATATTSAAAASSSSSASASASASATAASMQWPVWNPALMMGSMAGYSAEQWAALQQQNWQQWAQWQEQYARWQMQYGDKYSEQLTTLNNYAVGTQPPLPPANPSEARPPPPPDGPPPQIPKQPDGPDPSKNQTAHGFNSANGSNRAYYSYQGTSTAKPQYGAKKGKNATPDEYKYAEGVQWNEDGTVKIDTRQNDYHQYAKAGYSNDNSWYNQTQAAATYAYQNNVVNISEEEKQFDIQFKKWEEEFEAWKQQNINHPDKVAYQEYEKKFQACRAQLMERKEQMRAKRMATMMSQKPPLIPDHMRNSTAIPYYQSNQNFVSKQSSVGSVDKNFHSYDSNAMRGDNVDNYVSDNTNVFGKQGIGKSIPGLDLVPEEYSRRNNVTEIVDITDDKPASSKRPDLKAISKGINNILGDQKLLNMLSIVSQHKNDGNNAHSSKRPGSRWIDDISNANSSNSQTKYSNNTTQQYSYGDSPAQSYPQTSYSNTSQIPSLLDPLPFPPPFLQNNNQTSAQPEADKFSSAQSRLRANDSSEMDYNEPSMYRHDAYRTDQQYGNQDEYYEEADHGSFNVDNDRPPNDIGPAARPLWMDYPILEPATIVDYQHESLGPSIDFLEPVQTFDYGHMSSNKGIAKDDTKSNSSWSEYDNHKKNDSKNNDFQNRGLNDNDNLNDNSYYKTKNLEERYRDGDRSRRADRNCGRNRDYDKRDERSRNRYNEDRNRYRDRRDKYNRQSNSKERTLKKPGDAKSQSPRDDFSDKKDDKMSNMMDLQNVVMIDDILESPGREVRPEKIVIILRGLPGSGKSYLAKLIKDREIENGGSAPRILSMDDYFMSETEVSIEDPDTGRRSKKREMKYEYDESMEAVYISSLAKAFKRTIADGFFPFVIVDSINDQYDHYAEMDNIAKQYGFKVYICEMDVDVHTCHKRNIHDRKLEDIEMLNSNWSPIPSRFTTLDTTTLLQVAGIDHVQMEDVSDGDIDDQPPEPTPNDEEERDSTALANHCDTQQAPWKTSSS